MEDVSVLNETFNMYYSKAKQQHEAGNAELAKRNYLLAAETLMRMAKHSTAALKKAQFDRAKRLMEISENLTIPKKAAATQTQKQQAREGENSDEIVFAAATIPDISFNDIAGLSEVKKTITVLMLNPVKYPEKYAAYDKKTGGGVLLYGPPGTGKTMMAKAIAHEASARFYAIKGSDIVSKWVGDSEKNINALFNQARNDDRSIIFIDEMDSLFGSRGLDTHNDRRVNEFLQQIDGFSGKSPNMLLLGATNRPWDIDSAAVRSGRFSQKLYIPLPDSTARRFLFKMYTKNAPLAPDVDFDALVRVTAGYSGADIAEICDRAKEEPLEKYIATGQLVLVSQSDLLRAVKSLNPPINNSDLKRYQSFAGIKLTLTGEEDSIINADDGKESQTGKKDSSINKDDFNAALNDKSQKDRSNLAGAFLNIQSQDSDTDNSFDTDKNSDTDKNFDTDNSVKVFLDSDIISLKPPLRPKIEFALSKQFDKLYIVFDTQSYICKKKLNNYISDEINVSAPGIYNVDVLSGSKKIASFSVEVIKGIKENDFEI